MDRATPSRHREAEEQPAPAGRPTASFALPARPGAPSTGRLLRDLRHLEAMARRTGLAWKWTGDRAGLPYGELSEAASELGRRFRQLGMLEHHLFARRLAIDLLTCDPAADPVEVAGTLSALREELRALERHEEALEVSGRALALLRDAFSPRDTELWHALILALREHLKVLLDAGRSAEAGPFARELAELSADLAAAVPRHARRLALMLHELSAGEDERERLPERTLLAKGAVQAADAAVPFDPWLRTLTRSRYARLLAGGGHPLQAREVLTEALPSATPRCRPVLARELSRLAEALAAAGLPGEAAETVAATLPLHESLAEDDPQWAPAYVETLLRVSAHRLLTGRHRDARRLAERALAVAEPLPSKLPLALAHEHFSGLLARTGAEEDAERAARRALRCWRELAEADPERHREDLARAWQHLGNRLLALDRLEEAAAAVRRALDLLETGHPQRPGALNSLAVCLQRLGRHAAARDTARQAADALAQLGTDPHTRLRLAQVLANLSDHHAALREAQQAAAACVQATEILEELYERDPARYGPELLNVLPRTASRLAVIGDLEAAVRVATRDAEVLEALEGAQAGLDLGRTLITLGGYLNELQRYEEALPVLRRAEALCAQDPLSRAVALGRMSWSRYGLGDPVQAVRLIRRSIALLEPDEHGDGPHAAQLGLLLNDLSHHLRACRRPVEALGVAARATAIFERLPVHVPAHVRGLCIALREKARALSALGRHAQARALLERADELDATVPDSP